MSVINLDYFWNMEIVKQAKSLLAESSGLDIDIVTLDSAHPVFPCLCTAHSRVSSCNEEPHTECKKIPENIVYEAVFTKQNKFFLCPGGRRKVVVPVVLHDEVVGLIFVGENQETQLDKKKVHAVSQLVSLIANYILSNEMGTLAHYKGSFLTHQQQMLQRVVRFIEQNSRQSDLSLHQVARENGISYHYLSHLFSKEMKMTFVEFRNKVKMELAARLMKNFGLSVSEIAATCGFNDPSYFSKVFKLICGVCPEDFRRKLERKHSRGHGASGVQRRFSERLGTHRRMRLLPREQKITLERQTAPLTQMQEKV